MSLRFDIDRLEISVSGVSHLVVEQAIAGLEDELRRRLGTLTHASITGSELAHVQLPAIELGGPVDAAQLRGLLAERLVMQLGSHEMEEG